MKPKKEEKPKPAKHDKPAKKAKKDHKKPAPKKNLGDCRCSGSKPC